MVMKISRRRKWLALAALSAGSAAQAADPVPLAAICDASAGTGTSTVNPRLLRARLLELGDVSWSLLDVNGDGSISPRETFAALAYEQFCDANRVRENDRVRSAPCSGGERLKFMQARNLLRDFATHPQVRFVRISEPSPTDSTIQQGLRVEELWPLLDDQRRFVRMECGTAGTARDESGGRTAAAIGFRLRKNPEDLTIVPTPGLKNIPQAEISYVDDNVANTETFRVHGTAGFVIPTGGNHSLIPFVQFIRSHVEDTTGANTPQETAKLSLGVLSSWQLSSLDMVEFAPLYVNDLEDGAEFISVRAGWRPGFLYRIPTFRAGLRFLCARSEVLPNGRCRLGGQYFALRSDARVIATAGRVIDTGRNLQLVANRNYLRLGGEARLTLFGLRGLVRDLSADVSYRHLFGLDGNPDNLSALNVGVNYWIGGSPNASIRYGYERRRDEDTLKRTDQWTIAFGLRF